MYQQKNCPISFLFHYQMIIHNTTRKQEYDAQLGEDDKWNIFKEPSKLIKTIVETCVVFELCYNKK